MIDDHIQTLDEREPTEDSTETTKDPRRTPEFAMPNQAIGMQKIAQKREDKKMIDDHIQTLDEREPTKDTTEDSRCMPELPMPEQATDIPTPITRKEDHMKALQEKKAEDFKKMIDDHMQTMGEREPSQDTTEDTTEDPRRNSKLAMPDQATDTPTPITRKEDHIQKLLEEAFDVTPSQPTPSFYRESICPDVDLRAEAYVSRDDNQQESGGSFW